MQQLLESWLGANLVEGRLDFHVGEFAVTLVIGLLQPCQSLILFPEPAVDLSYVVRRNVASFGHFFQTFKPTLQNTRIPGLAVILANGRRAIGISWKRQHFLPFGNRLL